MKTHENMKNKKPFRAAQHKGHRKALDGALPWHGPKHPSKAARGSNRK